MLRQHLRHRQRHKELLESFREEMQLDRDIAGRQNMLSEQAAAEKAKLFEEILEEYM